MVANAIADEEATVRRDTRQSANVCTQFRDFTSVPSIADYISFDISGGTLPYVKGVLGKSTVQTVALSDSVPIMVGRLNRIECKQIPRISSRK